MKSPHKYGPSFRKRFGRNLADIRRQEGFTQATLAKKAGLTGMAISHFECGRRLPSLENFAQLLSALGDYAGGLLELPDQTPFHIFQGK